ncbi:MAG: sulfite exporter TauE/SafE family protein [Sedimentibacter saalensis]|uniref:urease accessory protein UreH domain-containing protein n=1 Tax=Sedimentibacter saalensis TaxID=130788 RepID=UPI003158098A
MQNSIEQQIIKIDGITCAACERKIEKAIKNLDGILSADVDYASATADISYFSPKVDLNDIYDAIRNAGYEVIFDDTYEEESSHMTTLFIGIILAGLYIIINNTVGFNFFPQVTSSMGFGMLFIAGLFTSVHCIAMCGGISLSQCAGCGGCENNIYNKFKPSFLYNLGRVTSYTFLGGLAGALGSVFSVSLKGKAFISLAAGLFMIVMGINMLSINSVLRKIIPRLPKALTDKIDSKRNSNGSFIVGLLNGFMPCGPLQAMQLYALGTGSFLTGALSMFIFGLGTVPLMFAFGAFSSLINSKFTKQMMKVSAMLVIILGVAMGRRGFSLAGINIAETLLSPLGINFEQNDSSKNAVIKDGYQTVTTNLESGKYQPITVYADVPLKWTITADKENLNGCNNEIIIPEFNKQQKLVQGENIIEFTPTKTGTITYTCWMGMISNTITVK